MSRRHCTGALAALAAASMSVAAWAQEIGMVTIVPDPESGEMRADIPARPDGESVYIMRDGKRIAQASIRSSGEPGGAVLALRPTEARSVKLGDRISLSPDLTKEQQLPLSAYQPVDPTKRGRTFTSENTGPMPSLSTVVQTQKEGGASSSVPPPSLTGTPGPGESTTLTRRTTVTRSELPEKTGAPVKGVTRESVTESQMTESRMTESRVAAVSPRLTPRASDIPLYPAPAVVPEAGMVAPYGVGLAAAAPVGTPYLRSPAFAGPPIIYMPQTVTRVLLPSVTPYPANIMAPPARYPYASAPFTRTDLYVNLPYGTYYWPNGYSGTTPVEPQIPTYVTAPATAVLTSEAAYTTQRYSPGAAQAETLNPISIPPAAAAGIAVEPSVIPVVPVGDQATVAARGVGAPPSLTTGVDTGAAAAGEPGAATSGVAPGPAALPPLEPLKPLEPFPSSATTIPAREPATLAPEAVVPAVPAPTPAVPAANPTGATLPATELPALPPLSPPSGAPAPGAAPAGGAPANPFTPSGTAPPPLPGPSAALSPASSPSQAAS